jgi:hypothetical protein
MCSYTLMETIMFDILSTAELTVSASIAVVFLSLAMARTTGGRGVDSDAKCNPLGSIGSSTKSRVSHSEPPPSARFPGDKDGSARGNIEPLQ